MQGFEIPRHVLKCSTQHTEEACVIKMVGRQDKSKTTLKLKNKLKINKSTPPFSRW